MPFKSLKMKHPTVFKLDYLLHLPPNYDEKRSYPLVLFLHGSGERGNDVQRVKDHGLPVYVEARPNFPAIVVAPQCPAGSWWSHEIYALMALLADIEYEYAVDVNRIYITGLSMGGAGVWELLWRLPDVFAAGVAVCAQAQVSRADEVPRIPIWMFHGEDDTTITVDNSHDMLAALEKHGHQHVNLTVYENVGHNSWEQAFNEPELYKWLWKQRRG